MYLKCLYSVFKKLYYTVQCTMVHVQGGPAKVKPLTFCW